MYQAADARYDGMTYNRCGSGSRLTPAVSLGFWHNFGSTGVYETMRKLCFTAFDNGVTHFDLANNYGPEPGSAEENLGRIMRKFHAASRQADHQHESPDTRCGTWLWKLGQPQIPACKPRSEPYTPGTSVCRHFLPSPDGPGDAA